MGDKEQFLWVEKYRPKKVADCILSSELKDTFSNYVKDNKIPNMILAGGPGTGKTTIARALCDEIGVDYLMVNGSDEGRNIDTVRTTLTQYCSSVSMSGNRKVVIMDEADYMNPDSVQPALRGFIEKFSGNVSFIFTCNFRNRIIDPIHSRCSVIEFVIPKAQRENLAVQFLDRCKKILSDEKVESEDKVIAELIMKHFPDFRRVLNELQKYSSSGKIDSGILSVMSEINMSDLMGFLKQKKFTEVRRWSVQNLDNDSVRIFRKIYDTLYDYLSPTTIPQAVLILADYQYKSAFVADQEINLVACLTEIMVECEFK
jgi:DNA polymerase III delta prime subunit